MAQIKSQIKRNKTNLKAQARNYATKSKIHTQSKKVLDAVNAKDKKKAETELKLANSVIDKAVSKGTIKKNKAAREKRSLEKAVAKVK